MKSSFGPKTVWLDTGEEVPVLVDRVTDLPLVLPLRWVVRTRRIGASANTVRADLYGVADLYAWDTAKERDFERRLHQADRLAPAELDSLIDYVREQPQREQGTIARRLRSIERFLLWAADPLNRGGNVYVPADELRVYQERLHATFEPYLTEGASRRPDPLDATEDEALRSLIGPVRGPGGRIRQPVRFSDQNPFRPASRVRNWLIYLLERDLGLRIGEVLALKLEDCPRGRRSFFAIRRRPDDPDDPRRRKPQVKTSEGLVESNPIVDLALRLYLADPRNPGRRARGAWPYLITAAGTGRPLTFQAVDLMWEVVAKRWPWFFQDDDGRRVLTNHQLRHTWAEELARRLILDQQVPRELAIETLRAAGRWREGSMTPFHYIQNAIAELARRIGRARVDAMYPDPGDDDE